jgi:hypothetical protein
MICIMAFIIFYSGGFHLSITLIDTFVALTKHDVTHQQNQFLLQLHALYRLNKTA